MKSRVRVRVRSPQSRSVRAAPSRDSPETSALITCNRRAAVPRERRAEGEFRDTVKRTLTPKKAALGDACLAGVSANNSPPEVNEARRKDRCPCGGGRDKRRPDSTCSLADGQGVTVVDRRGPLMGSTPASTALLFFEIDIPLIYLKRKLGARRAERAWAQIQGSSRCVV